MSSERGPLAGVTVVALEQAVAAPMATRTLGDLGARVVKIENPRGGDFTRTYDQVVNGQAAHFVWLNRGKESVALNVRHPDGRAVLDRLLARADVLVSNLAPGATARLGLAPDELERDHPHLTSVEMSGYGTGGPLSGKRAYDLLVQAETGVCSLTGTPDAPAKPGPPFADGITGLYAAISVLGALAERRVTGRGARIAVSMFDAMAEFMGYPLTWTAATGVEQEPVGMGSPAVAPYGAFPTADGRTVVLGTTNDAEWTRLAALLGEPGLAERYPDNPSRVAHRADLDAIVGAWCAARPLAEIQAAADAAGIGNAVYRTTSEVLAHPQLASRDRWRAVDTPGGPVDALLPPPIVAGRTAPMGPVPALGEHTDAVLAELGYTSEDVAELRAAQVLGPLED
ncbi:CaiB/BaiF CoA transferase family protein [Cryptosporangium arvum]|uniref:CaiB/BaiF CoA transferase family protein n=1 Tax=Cryptosporangium arvum TaxID=80871 RepID=UPI001B8058CF|nr:CaiB/BaiF CoA-transferase family protein [Cryptosporangium arvum]